MAIIKQYTIVGHIKAMNWLTIDILFSHGGGKRRHYYTLPITQKVCRHPTRRGRRAWRRLPPPCQAQPHLPPFVCVIKCRFPSQAASHLLGNGKCIVVAALASAMPTLLQPWHNNLSI